MIQHLSLFLIYRCGPLSALALLVPRVGANHHDAAVTTDDTAVLADPLHTWLNLHGFPLLVSVRNSTTGQIVWAHFKNDAVLGQNANIILPHFA